MRSRIRFTPRKTICAAAFMAAFIAMILFLFSLDQDERLFNRITSDLFYSEMVSNTLNMHYTLAQPADFGIRDYEAVLPCYSPDESSSSLIQTENLLNKLHSLNSDKLSPQNQITHALLVSSLENSLALGNLPYYEEPLSPSSGMQSQLPILLAEYTFRSSRDVEDYLKLLDQTDEYFEALLVFEQEKADAGLLMSSVSLKKVVEQCDTILNEEELNAGTHFLQTTFQERLEPLIKDGAITQEKALSYISQNNRLLRTVMRPAYEALGDGLIVLEDPSIPLAGLASHSEGAVYYEQLLLSQTGSSRSVSEIKEILTAQFEREYNALKDLIVNTPSLATQSYDRLLEREFPLQNAAQMLMDLQQRMADDFPPLDQEEPLPSVAIKPVSQSLQNYCAPAFYLTPPLDDTSSNAIYINEKSTPNGLELYTTLAHEGYPGHMYQSVYHNRAMIQQGDITANVRELLWYGGYLEGWALYVEFISFDYASELYREQSETAAAATVGTSASAAASASAAGSASTSQEALPDTETLMAAIQLAKHDRSLLLCLYSLLDIMIHYENASQEQVAELLGRFGITSEASVNAVYEYIVEEPANYLKYYLGYLEILELKNTAKKLWGDAYSDYGFHTFFLESGPADFGTLQEMLMEQNGQ